MVRPLTYYSGLTLEQAEERYREIRDEFQRIKSHYSGFFGRFRKKMKDDDKKSLEGCIGIILPLGLEDSVQSQIRQLQKVDSTLFNKIAELQCEILDYLANFKNTGVTRLTGTIEGL